MAVHGPVIDVAVVGAGPAGLATSRELRERGIGHTVLERGDTIAHVWEHLYDGLVLHTGKHLSSLPGLRFPGSAPLFPTRRDFLDYLRTYAARFNVPVQTDMDVLRVTREEYAWRVEISGGRTVAARTVVMATGIVSNPVIPVLPGRSTFRGTLIHSALYRRPAPFAGSRVLVVGAGNSAGEIAAELANAGARVTVSVRSGARVVPRRLFGLPIQYYAVALSALPSTWQTIVNERVASAGAWLRGGPVLPPPPADRTCGNLPMVGFHLVDAIRTGRIALRPGVKALTPAGVRFDGGGDEAFDAVILATGYTAAIGPLGGLVSTDACGFPLRNGRVASSEAPGLFFVGHNYDTHGALRNISKDARIAARLVFQWLRPPGTAPTSTGRTPRTSER